MPVHDPLHGLCMQCCLSEPCQAPSRHLLLRVVADGTEALLAPACAVFGRVSSSEQATSVGVADIDLPYIDGTLHRMYATSTIHSYSITIFNLTLLY